MEKDPVPSTLDWDLWLGPAPMRPFQAKWPEGHAVYSPERKRQFAARGALYHPFVWRRWTEFGSGAMGDIAAHSMNMIFMALELGAPSIVEVLETSGMKKEMFPDWSTVRFDFAQKGNKPKVSVFWYDGAQPLPKHLQAKRDPNAPTTGPNGQPLRGGQAGWFGSARREVIRLDADPSLARMRKRAARSAAA